MSPIVFALNILTLIFTQSEKAFALSRLHGSRPGWSESQPEERTPIMLSSRCSESLSTYIMSSVLPCTPRPELVKLKPNITGSDLLSVVQVTPSFANVERCSGSCLNAQYKCLPTMTENLTIPIMVVQTTYSTGILNTFCTNITVERHTSCKCSCRQRPEHCDPTVHIYDLPRCSCRCKNLRDKATCGAGNSQKKWDSKTCSCRCPRERWNLCSTGFTYDFTDTCSCVPVSSRIASGGLTFIVLFVCVYIFATTIIVSYYRRKVNRHRIRVNSQLENLLREAFLDDSKQTNRPDDPQGNMR